MSLYYQDAAVTIHHGNALNLPLEDASVDLCVTSPPYFGLRSYQDAGEHYAGHLGSEATPGEFLDTLIAATAEMVRVLKPSGSIFVNLGDKYAQAEERSRNGNGNRVAVDGFTGGKPLRGPTVTLGHKDNGVPRKSLLGIPWRYAIRCIDDLGLILRAEIIWSKPNGLPESVTDRVRRSHEQWFHFTREPRYFSAIDEIRESHVKANAGRLSTGRAFEEKRNGDRAGVNSAHLDGNPVGKLPGSVWTIPTEPLTVPDHLGIDHFAAFPLEWPLRIIRGWSPSGICTVCGEGRRPVADRSPMQWRPSPTLDGRNAPGTSRQTASGTMLAAPETRITGYACACPDTTAPIRPAVILDPFMGTGTTLLAAKALGRLGIGNDLSKDYCRLAQWRCTDPGELAKAMRVEKPPPVMDGQGALL